MPAFKGVESESEPCAVITTNRSGCFFNKANRRQFTAMRHDTHQSAGPAVDQETRECHHAAENYRKDVRIPNPELRVEPSSYHPSRIRLG